MEEPTYHLAGVMHTRDELPADFDGPLSVILLLLSKNKIEIQDVSITSILEQYLAYLDEMKRLDMEIASEFIAMASHLMLIKTKMLLSAAEREEAMSEMELLIRSLEEKQRAEAYEQIRTAVAFLEPRSDIRMRRSRSVRTRPIATATSRRTFCAPWRPWQSAASGVCRRSSRIFRASSA